MAELLDADLSDLETTVMMLMMMMMIDGLNVAGEIIVVAVVINTDATKAPVGLRLGDTKNATGVRHLVARGLRYAHGILA